MGRFKSNALVLRHRRSPRNECDSGRLSGSLAAFKFAIDPELKNPRSDSFWKECAPRPLLLFQKMRGWLRDRAVHRLLQRHHGQALPLDLRWKTSRRIARPRTKKMSPLIPL